MPRGDAAIPAGVLLQPLLDRGEEDFLFLVGRLVEEGRVAPFGPHAKMDEQGRVAAIVEDEVRAAAVTPFKDAVGIIPVIDQALALAREDRNAGGGDGGGGMVLRRIDIAGGPAQIRAQRPQRLDQHGGLHRHMQRTGDARAGERLGGADIRPASPSAPAFPFRRCRSPCGPRRQAPNRLWRNRRSNGSSGAP